MSWGIKEQCTATQITWSRQAAGCLPLLTLDPYNITFLSPVPALITL